MLQHQFPLLLKDAIALALTLVALASCWLARRPLRWLLARVIAWLIHLDPQVRTRDQAAIQSRIRDALTLPTNYLAAAIGFWLPHLLLSGILGSQVPNFDRIAWMLLSIAIAIFAGTFINQLVLGANRHLNLLGVIFEPQLLPFFHSFVWAAIIFLTVVFNLQMTLGIDATALLAGTGLLGLAISLAAKDTAENLLGYFVIIMERPFLIGDYIRAADVTGNVEHVGWRSTRIRQMDQVLVSVPNRNLTAANIWNWQRMAKQMLELRLRIAYGARPEQLQQFLDATRTLLQQRPLVEQDSIVVLFTQLGDDALEVLVRSNILEPKWLAFQLEQEAITLQIMQIVDRCGLEIALPTRKLYVQSQASSGEQDHEVERAPSPAEKNNHA